MRLVLMVMLLMGSTGLIGQEYFSGLFIKDSLAYHYSDALIGKDFYQLDDSLSRNGFVLSDWNLNEGNELMYRGIWRPDVNGIGGEQRKEGATWKEFVKIKRAQVKSGYLMTNIQHYSDLVGTQHFIGKWRQDSTTHKVWKFSTFEHLKKKVRAMKKDNFVLVEVEVNMDGNRNPLYMALFHKKKFLKRYSYCFEAKKLQLFNKEVLMRHKSGYHLSDIEVYYVKGKAAYIGVFKEGKKDAIFIAGLEEDAFYAQWEELEKDGYILVDLEW